MLGSCCFASSAKLNLFSGNICLFCPCNWKLPNQMIISSFFCKTVKCGIRFEPNLIRYSKLRSTVLTRDGWTYRKLNLDLRIQSISELNDEEFKHVTSSAKNFFQHIGSADNSFESLSCLASLVVSYLPI